MRIALTAVAASLLVLSPMAGASCDDAHLEAMASSAPADQRAAPATQTPAPTVAKATDSKAQKRAPSAVKTPVPEAKVVAAKAN